MIFFSKTTKPNFQNIRIVPHGGGDGVARGIAMEMSAGEIPMVCFIWGNSSGFTNKSPQVVALSGDLLDQKSKSSIFPRGWEAWLQMTSA